MMMWTPYQLVAFTHIGFIGGNFSGRINNSWQRKDDDKPAATNDGEKKSKEEQRYDDSRVPGVDD